MSSSDYIVTAVLMAKDRNFQSTFEAANKTTQTLGGKIKSGLGFGALAGIGAKAVGVVGGSLKSLVSEQYRFNHMNDEENYHPNIEMLERAVQAAKEAVEKGDEGYINTMDDV